MPFAGHVFTHAEPHQILFGMPSRSAVVANVGANSPCPCAHGVLSRMHVRSDVRLTALALQWVRVPVFDRGGVVYVS